MTTNIHSRLFLSKIELCVYLGWPEGERVEAQMVSLDLTIQFAEPPKACLTDHLDDTFCYAELISKIHAATSTTPYRLLEHLCYDIYHLIKLELPAHTSLRVDLTKHPKIMGLTGGVCFSYGDEK